MTEKKKSLIYSLSREVATSLHKEAEEHLLITYDYLTEALAKHKQDGFKISLLCDYYSSTYKLKVEMEKALQPIEPIEPGKPEEKDIFISQESMVIIETISLSRYYLAKDLQEFSNLSFHLH